MTTQIDCVHTDLLHAYMHDICAIGGTVLGEYVQTAVFTFKSAVDGCVAISNGNYWCLILWPCRRTSILRMSERSMIRLSGMGMHTVHIRHFMELNTEAKICFE